VAHVLTADTTKARPPAALCDYRPAANVSETQATSRRMRNIHTAPRPRYHHGYYSLRFGASRYGSLASMFRTARTVTLLSMSSPRSNLEAVWV
jgi:hypothetical protein